VIVRLSYWLSRAQLELWSVEQRLLATQVEGLISSVGRAFVRVVNGLALNMSKETRLKIAGVHCNLFLR
jgi:hypothetical protein